MTLLVHAGIWGVHAIETDTAAFLGHAEFRKHRQEPAINYRDQHRQQSVSIFIRKRYRWLFPPELAYGFRFDTVNKPRGTPVGSNKRGEFPCYRRHVYSLLSTHVNTGLSGDITGWVTNDPFYCNMRTAAYQSHSRVVREVSAAEDQDPNGLDEVKNYLLGKKGQPGKTNLKIHIIRSRISFDDYTKDKRITVSNSTPKQQQKPSARVRGQSQALSPLAVYIRKVATRSSRVITPGEKTGSDLGHHHCMHTTVSFATKLRFFSRRHFENTNRAPRTPPNELLTDDRGGEQLIGGWKGRPARCRERDFPKHINEQGRN
ncbi:hypothetical protein GWI33_018995 [Rhynchophorus ferrugineus]|uniref:Uncharacterized protein n=1 Tax=Rhynchophorus ferrugineus TaxID=354439 RepID=A0A834HUU5_RHYFE|nr:hypothetical protein GWI33_018995 [Rhynchophorus ferrugineus]